MTRLPLVRTVSAVGVLAVVVFAQVGLVLAPSQLGRHPLLVLALRPTPAFLVLVGDAVLPAAAILIASVGRTMVDVAYFAVARYGTLPVVERFGIGRGLTRGLSRRTASRGLLTVLFFWSSTPIIAAIGLGRTRLLTFVAVTCLGNLVTSGVYVFFGHQFSAYLAPVTAWLSAQGIYLTVALGAAVAVSAFAALRRSRPHQAPAPVSST